jgi:hypothetical protein
MIGAMSVTPPVADMKRAADRHPPGNEAPLVITPRAVVSLIRRTAAVVCRRRRR